MNCTICGLPTGNIVGSVLPQCKCGWQAPQPPKAQRQPLTDEEILKVWEQAMVKDNGAHARLDNQPFVHFARAIEAAHGIKEKNT